MEYYIRIISCNGPVQKYKIEQGETLVGRSRSAGIRVKDPDVSGKHFLLRRNGDEISVENLSANGIRVDDQAFFENTVVNSGQHIYAGSTLDCIIENEKLSAENDLLTFGSDITSESEATDPSHNSKFDTATNQSVATGTGNDIQSQATANDTSPSSDTAHSSDTDHSANTGDSKTGHGDTVANKTRVATPDEIQFIKEQKQNRFSRLRFLRIALLLLVCVILAIVFFFNSDAGFSDGSWPRKADGKHAIATASFPGQSLKDGGFALFFPDVPGNKIHTGQESIEVYSALGSKSDIPFTLKLNTTATVANLKLTLRENFEKWIASCGGDQNERWVFEQISSLQFYGNGNGLPSLSVNYVRESNGKSSYGIARIFRNADTTWILTVEVPFAFRDRCEAIFANNAFVMFSRKFVDSHWEGGVPAVKYDIARLKAMQSSIRRTSPAKLSQTFQLVNGVLVDAKMTGNAAKLQIGQIMLAQLREVQKLHYNSMKIKHINAKLERDHKLAEKVRAECAAIFSLNNDRRFYDVRKNQW